MVGLSLDPKNQLLAGYFRHIEQTRYAGIKIAGSIVLSFLTLAVTISLSPLFNAADRNLNNGFPYPTVIAYPLSLLVLFLLLRRWLAITPRTFGATKPRFYLLGVIIGVFILSIPMLCAVVTNANQLTLNLAGVNFLHLGLFLILFVFQGAQEEIICRGLIFLSLCRKVPVVWAMVISSSLFAVFHFANPAVSYVAVLNLFLFGFAMAYLYYRSENLLLVSAIHSAWNFTQLNIYDFPVSGLGFQGITTVFNNQANTKNLINGGAFGLEGSLITSMVLILLLVATFCVYHPRNTKH